ncbi:helix-turn-helix domain-containing protein [Geodermatophilus sp. DF01-2]|uniref:helix-turn-helix domain-containing protein n=1 Tax=Geodermatophilus sp. DF01-2 TaxID=2559610 RepID=UPI0010730A9A|nr:helix-turn-helix domain-containing protein [Geodermatophilus sp. DF01_2]TFV64269.1 helix-turn-helix domain-containing protein [Geodermatophilus sp. DF01_2]
MSHPAQTLNDGGLAQALQSWRHKEGLSRLAAARRLGVANTTLRSWELEAVRPQPLQLRLVAQALGTDTDVLRALAGPDRIRTACTSGGPNAAPLCRARLAAGLTMTQLARKVGVVPATLSRWEDGLRAPSPDARVRLGRALGLDPDELAGMLADSRPRRSDGVLLPGLGQLRRQRGLTQRAFRTAVGIGATAANAWEHGRVRVPHNRLGTVAGVLGLDEKTLVAISARPPQIGTGKRSLSQLRRAAGLTQRELAHHLEASVRSVAHWEAGTRPLPMAMVRPMARCLRRPLRTILNAADLELPALTHPGTWTPTGLPGVLTALRQSTGWSAAALGRRLGTSGRVVRGWETGVAVPSVSFCHRLEMVHGLPRGALTRLVSGAGLGSAVRQDRLKSSSEQFNSAFAVSAIK